MITHLFYNMDKLFLFLKAILGLTDLQIVNNLQYIRGS